MRLLRSLLLFASASGAIALHASVAVSISPTTATVSQGATKTFTATVTGSTNTAVTWASAPTTGLVSTSGLFTAPAVAGMGYSKLDEWPSDHTFCIWYQHELDVSNDYTLPEFH